MLKAQIDAEGFGALGETVQQLYKPDGDGYVLQVEGMTTKTKVDEFRDNNIELKKQLDAYKGIDIEEFKTMKQELEKRKMEELKPDERAEVIRADFQNKLDAATAALEEAQNQLAQQQQANVDIIKKFEIQGATQKAFAEHKIRPEAQASLTALINQQFTVKEGAVVAMEDGKIKAGANGNLTISEFVGAQDDFMKIPSEGGHGKGGGGGNTPTPKTSTEKISAGLRKRAG